MTHERPSEPQPTWREELPKFDATIPFAVRQLLHTDPAGSYPNAEMMSNITRVGARKLFVGIADGLDRRGRNIEDLTVDILLSSVRRGNWVSIVKIPDMQPLVAAASGLTYTYEAQQSALEHGLLEEMPIDQNTDIAPHLIPTAKFIEGIAARINGDMTFQLIPTKTSE